MLERKEASYIDTESDLFSRKVGLYILIIETNQGLCLRPLVV
jgi:hypothetical protein